MPFLNGLQLADPEFDCSGRIDTLVGIVACNECTYDEVVSSCNRRFKAHKTIFGWAIGGERPSASDQKTTTVSIKASAKKDSQDTLEDSQASVERDSDRRYGIKSPWRDPTPELAN